ncbi:MAG: 5,6-dimethylbenzimidazole synthase [Paracoccus sp. (in: a-proteobacteria)]|nr:5,6-dimethylbenzimidazole synthase [Paracoccus sp. (in: a-proteobacteria)]
MTFDEDHRAALHDLLKWRRDVRHFRDEKLPDHAAEVLRTAMALAPSVGNARPWRVIEVQSSAVRARIRANFEAANARAAARYSGERGTKYAALKLAGLDRAPLQLAIFNTPDPDEGHGLGRASIPETVLQSTAMAIFALWLTARAHNWGVGMVSILDPALVERDLTAPEGWRFAAYLCIGWPERDDDTPLLHRAGWQENTEREWRRA